MKYFEKKSEEIFSERDFIKNKILKYFPRLRRIKDGVILSI